jgi:hypothetical protein
MIIPQHGITEPNVVIRKFILLELLVSLAFVAGCAELPDSMADDQSSETAELPEEDVTELLEEEPPPPGIGEISLDVLAAGALIVAEIEVLAAEPDQTDDGPGNLPDHTASIHYLAWSARVTWANSRHYEIPSGVVMITRVEDKQYFDAQGSAAGEMRMPALDGSPGLEPLEIGEHLLVALVPGSTPDEFRLVGAWHPERHLADLTGSSEMSLPDFRERLTLASRAAGEREAHWRDAIDQLTPTATAGETP